MFIEIMCYVYYKRLKQGYVKKYSNVTHPRRGLCTACTRLCFPMDFHFANRLCGENTLPKRSLPLPTKLCTKSQEES